MATRGRLAGPLIGTLLIGLVAAAGGIGGLVLLTTAAVVGVGGVQPPSERTCRPGIGTLPEGPQVAGLSGTQSNVVRGIYAAAQQVAADEGWTAAQAQRATLIALITAKVESQWGTWPGYDRPNADHDAGYFQQRILPGWYGTVEQVNDIPYATRVFLTGRTITAADVAAARRNGTEPAGPAGYVLPGLKQVRDWQSMSPGAAAQAVQRSAYPDRYGAQEQLARTILLALAGDGNLGAAELQDAAADVLCSNQAGGGGEMDCPATGSPAEKGLKPDAIRVLRCVTNQFPQIQAADAVGIYNTSWGDHPSGRAVDLMIPNYQDQSGIDLGTRIADWIRQHHAQLGVRYIIWREHIWNVDRDREGWRECQVAASTSCYKGPDDSASHRNHVHVSVIGNAAGTPELGGTGPVKPVTGYRLTSRFGQCRSGVWRNCHTGLDFAAPTGAPIRAVLDGTVISVSRDCGNPSSCPYGNLTKVSHSGKVSTYYAHQSEVLVKPGDKVVAGQVIGKVGHTGNVRPRGPAGSHLHLEVRLNGDPVDPDRWYADHGLDLG